MDSLLKHVELELFRFLDFVENGPENFQTILNKILDHFRQNFGPFSTKF